MESPTDGVPPSIDELFERNLPRLVAFIRARAGQAIAKRESAVDLAQSVCREVLQDLDQFEYRGEAAFRAWLFRQATRKIIDRSRYLHRDRRDVSREQVAATGAGSAESLLDVYAAFGTPSQHVAAREEVERIEAAVQALPEAQRDAVTMSRLLGLGYEEIAAVLGTSESAVRGLTARGLAALAKQLERQRAREAGPGGGGGA